MSRAKTWVLIVVLVFVVVMAIAIGTGFYYLTRQQVEVRKDTIVEVSVGGSAYELPAQSPFNLMWRPRALSLWELGELFRYAAGDERVSGVYLEIYPLVWSWGQLEELRDHIRHFQESGKPVHALVTVDMMTDAEMYLASVADSVTLNPNAGLLVNGLMAEVTFFKRTLEKLGIQPQFIQFKEYKSPERFSREKMTPAIREMLQSVLQDLQQRFVQTVARDRGIDAARLRNLVNQGMAQGDVAVQENLVDRLGYKDDLEKELEVGEEGDEEYRSIAAAPYLASVRDKFRVKSRHKVALLGGIGGITSGRSEPLAGVIGGITVSSHLRKIRKDDDIKGVIFRVDSPGGSAVGSDMIWREVRLLEETGKPVVVSMSGVAGSGGYYISMGAHRIISQPSTITGSIGVIFGKFDVTGLYDWLGVDVERVKTSPNADILSPFASLTEAQKEQVESWMERIYTRFVERAAEGRNQESEELEKKARGRIYTGSQALDLGLVDELGGLRSAVEHMKEILDIGEEEQIELVLYPKPKALWEALLSEDLWNLGAPPSPLRWLQREMKSLATPAPWLLIPEIRIH